MQNYKDLASELVEAVQKSGADACDVFIVSSNGFTVTVRLGKVEKLQQSNTKGLGLRVVKNGAMANTFTTDFSDKAVRNLARETMEIVQISSADEFNGLAPQDFLGSYGGNLEIFDESIAALPTETKIEMAKAAEDAGFKFDERITNADGTSWNDSRGQITLANSAGFVGQYQTTSASLAVGLLAEENGVKQSDYWFTSNRFLNKLDAPEVVGTEAARRTIRKLGGKKVKSQVVPVVFDPMVSGDFVNWIFDAAAGGKIYRRSSFLVDRIGDEIGSPLVTIVDDATIFDGLASRPFDGEGVKSSNVTIVENGVLQNYVCDSYAARRLNLQPTGNASRNYQGTPNIGATNLYLKNGATEPLEIIKSIKNGLYLTELFGFGLNSVTGSFSQGAAGFWIENGEITFPVQEITLAGNALKVLRDVAAVGNDLSFKLGSTAAPTLLVSEMTIGGE